MHYLKILVTAAIIYLFVIQQMVLVEPLNLSNNFSKILSIFDSKNSFLGTTMLRSKQTFGIPNPNINNFPKHLFTTNRVMQLQRQLENSHTAAPTTGDSSSSYSSSQLLCQQPMTLFVSTPRSFPGGLFIRTNKWMEQLLSTIGNTPITKLKIPATHNSASYNVSLHQEYSSDTKSDPSMALIPQLVQIFRAYGLNTMRIKQFVAPWFKNQECTIYQQLNQGIRHLDLRVCKQPVVGGNSSSAVEGKYVACHGLVSVSIANVLRQVKQFLNENKKEVVTLDFNHLYDFTSMNDHLEFLNMSRSILGNELLINPSQFSTNSTLNELLRTTSQRIFFYYYHSTTVINYGQEYNLFPSWRIDTRWANKQQMTLLKNQIISELNSRNNYQFKFVSQILLTPDLNMMVNGLFESPKSVKELASMNYRVIPSWILNDLPSNQMNVINTDYYHLFGEQFISSIIRKNLI